MSMGAKRIFILLQFLLESVILCLLGGGLGIALVGLMVYLLPILISDFDFEIAMSFGNIMQGIVISVLIGLISGFVPAYMASRLNPVDAIRAGQ
jgi:putative ABC transport system permease protein